MVNSVVIVSINYITTKMVIMLRDIRKQYDFASFNENDAEKDALNQFRKWLNDALKSEQMEPTAMVLSTVDSFLQPHSRVVLLKDLTQEGLFFYSNYESNKANQLHTNNRVAVLFFWESLERQVRFTGSVEKISEEASVDYFASRPIDSQLGAWASPQSRSIVRKAILDENYERFKLQFGSNIPKPPHWGGYLIRPNSIEFWQGRPSRLHDRIVYYKKEIDWVIHRLAP